MIITKYVCDKCNKETKTPIFLSTDIDDKEEFERLRSKYPDEMCFCEKCIDKFLAADKQEVVPDQKESDPKEQTQAPQKKKVDTGKLLALHKAGLGPKAIGEELGIPAGTVSTYLWKQKKEGLLDA